MKNEVFSKECGIYCYENLIDGKKYIGQSINLTSRMFSKHSGCTYLINAITKHGIENFNIYVLEYCDEFLLNEKEIFWIKEMSSHVSENGYNISFGGNSPMRGRHHTEETKAKIRENIPDNSGKNNPMYGKEVSEETREKISLALSGENSYMWKKEKSKETREKISNTRIEKYKDKDGDKLGKKHKVSYSSYYGVQRNLTKGYVYWRVSFYFNKKKIVLGNHKKEMNAAIEYDEYVLENKLDLPLNFPTKYDINLKLEDCNAKKNV